MIMLKYVRVFFVPHKLLKNGSDFPNDKLKVNILLNSVSSLATFVWHFIEPSQMYLLNAITHEKKSRQQINWRTKLKFLKI